MSIYKDCDIRGIYQKEITARDANRIGHALAALLDGRRILVGGDVRLSTPELKNALIDGLIASGAQVTDLGTIPTPALYYAMKRLNAYAGATVTASHNPPEYNGIKFMLGDQPVTRDTIDRVRDIALRGDYPTGSGTIDHWDAAADYMDFLSRRFRIAKPLHVLIDAGNGAMSAVAPEVFRRACCRVTELFCTPDGAFPNRSPNPADYTCLTAAGAAVRACGADFGVAFDGDGDRAVFLNERGEPIQNEKSFSLFIRAALADHPAPVVYDQKSSSIVRDTVLEMGGTPLPERSGHAFIKRRFLENHAAVAGEVSGHFFFGELGYDDGLFAALYMAELLAQREKTLSELTDAIRIPPITPDLRYFCPYDRQEECLRRAEHMAAEDGAQISRMDGVRADFGDRWFLIRKSVTAEQITLRAEAQTQDQLTALVDRILAVLPEDVRRANDL